MKKVVKFISILLLLLLVIGGGAIWYGVGNLDRIIKEIINTQAPAATQLPVSVQAVETNFRDYRISLGDLRVGNLPGFDTPHAIMLGDVSAQMGAINVANRLFTLNEVVIDAPDINVEFKSGKINLKEIQSHLQSLAGEPDPTVAAARAEGEQDVRLIIDNLYIRNAKVSVSGAPGVGSKSYTLKQIHLKDIGRASNGATIRAVAFQTLGPVISQTLQQIVSMDPSSLRELIGPIDSSIIREGAGQLLPGGVGDLIGEDAVEDGLKSIEDKAKDLLPSGIGDRFRR